MNEIRKVADNWRNISKSDYIASIDVESLMKSNGGQCILTIRDAVQHLADSDAKLPPKQQFRMNGQRGNWNIIHFEQKVKSMVCNVTNSKTLYNFCDKGRSEDESVKAWIGLTISIAVDKTIEYQGNRGGIIIVPELPEIAQPELSLSTPNFEGFRSKVLDRIAEMVADGSELEESKKAIRLIMEEHYSFSEEVWSALCQ